MRAIFAGIITLILSSIAPAQTTRPAIPDDIKLAISRVDPDLTTFKDKQFVAYDPNYISERAAGIAKLRTLAAQVFAREAAGQNIERQHQILIETYWVLICTADFKRADRRMGDLKQLLDETATRPSTAPANLAEITGPPYSTVWYCRLDAAYNQLESDKSFQFPRELLDWINSPEKLAAYFKAVNVSDIAHNGVDHEEEQNEPLADLMRLILRDQPRSYTFDPRLKETIVDLILHQLRDPVTGFWGERYIVDGQTLFVPDLSTTFHVINYLSDAGIEVPDMDRIVATTLAVKERNSPVGWTFRGEQYNHNCMDVIDLFKWSWPHVGKEQREAIARETQSMIHRCLAESLQSDGSFKHLSIDSSIEEAEHFGGCFLAHAGYFDPAARFWSDPQVESQSAWDQDLAQAAEVRRRIIGFIKKHLSSGATGGVYYKSTLKDLRYDPSMD